MAGTRTSSRASRAVRALALAALAAAISLAGCGGSSRKHTTAQAAPAPSTTAAAPPSPQHPNIVFVLTDDLAWNLVQFMPHVLQMQHTGTTFSNYFVTDSLCCPSRASIFTGRLPHDTDIFTNAAPDGGFPLFHQRGEEASTFATALQSQGYQTALMGKYLNGYKPAQTLGTGKPYVPQGWNEWDVAGNAYAEFDYPMNSNGTVTRYDQNPSDYLTDVLSGRGIQFIDREAAQHQPFLLEIATFAPHSPYTPAPRNAADFPGLTAPRTPAYDNLGTDPPAWLADHPPLTPRQERRIDRAFRKRAQAVEAVDQMIGRIESELQAKGIAGNTYIVFSSDNGLHMGEHRLTPGKMTAFDTDIKVPLIVTGPGVPAGATVDQLTENIDLAPTFEELAGGSPPPTVDGHTLVPFLKGQAPTGWRDAVLIEHHGPDTIQDDPDLPEPGSGNPPSYEAMRTPDSVYVEYADGELEYYDLTADPNELDNIAQSLPPSKREDLHNTLQALETCHGAASCWAAEGGG